MDVETDPLAVYVVIEYGPHVLVHGPFASMQLAEKWTDGRSCFLCRVHKLRPVSDDAPAEPEASRG